MNNKDLFNAINNIDDKFITDAGKYLKNDESFISSYYADPVEVRPADRKFSLMRLIAPIAAAAILVCSITIALKTRILYPAETTDMILGESKDTAKKSDTLPDTAPAVGSADLETSPEGVINMPSAAIPNLDKYGSSAGELPFTLYGPDYKQITYEEVTEIHENVSKQYLNDSNWVSITCDGFAYIADPLGENYNRADDSEKFDSSEIAWNVVAERSFKRIYEGEQYSGFTVKRAYSTFSRTPTNGMTEQQMKENNLPLSRLYQGSYLELDGSIEMDVYIVKYDDNRYICVTRNGAASIPTMNINVRDDGSFGSYLYSDDEFGFEFKTELPYIRIDPPAKNKHQIDKLFTEKIYQKARVILSDIIINYDAAAKEPYGISATVDVIDMQLGYSDIEPRDVSALISRTATVKELEKEVLNKYDALSEVRVYREVYDITEDIIFGDELTEEELYSGLTVGLYDQNGLVGIYTYQQK